MDWIRPFQALFQPDPETLADLAGNCASTNGSGNFEGQCLRRLNHLFWFQAVQLEQADHVHIK